MVCTRMACVRPSCRRQYGAFLSDILLPDEKENKALEGEIQSVFTAISVEGGEELSAATAAADAAAATQEGSAHPDQHLCEQVRVVCACGLFAVRVHKLVLPSPPVSRHVALETRT